MATTYTAKSYADPAWMEHNRVITRFAADVTREYVVNDVVKFFKLPRGAKILGGYIECPDIDTHATPAATLSLIVTDGTTPTTIINASTIGQAGGIVVAPSSATGCSATGWMGYVTPSENFYVEVKCAAAPATSATGVLKAGITYTCDIENGDL